MIENTAEPDAGDVERDRVRVEGDLALSLHRTGLLNLPLADDLDIDCRDAARAVLASDWLAADRAATAERALTVVAIHRLHASMNICTGCDWRATPNAGSLTDQHWAHVTDRASRIARGEGR